MSYVRIPHRPVAIRVIDQKITDERRGDCMIACIATVLGVDYDWRLDLLRESIEFLATQRQFGGRWFDYLQGWALGCGYHLRFETVPDEVPVDALTIAGGPSPRGVKAGHAVVMVGAGPKVLHDPHPSRDGLAGDPDDWMWFDRVSAADSFCRNETTEQGHSSTSAASPAGGVSHGRVG